MKQRIRYLEDEQQRHEQNAGGAPTSQTSPTQAGRFPRPRTTSTNLGLEITGHVVDVAANEVEYLSLTAMSGGNKNDQNVSSSLTFRQVMECIVSTNGTDPGLVMTDTFEPTEHETSLAQIESEIKAATGKDYLYFIRVFTKGLPWYFPPISDARCIAAFDAVRQSEAGATSGTTAASMPDSIVVAYSVLALGATVSPHHAVLQKHAIKIVDVSKRALSRVLTTADDVTAIQCLVLQTLLSLYYPCAGSTWHLLGLALSKAVSAGLHRSTSATTEGEEAANAATIFWLLYVLDRNTSSLMGRPLGLQDDDIALELPALATTQSVNDIAAASEAMFVWKVHHARMLSQWRQSSSFDLDVGFASYEYWNESYHEVCERLGQLLTTENQSDEVSMTLRANIQREKVALSCRALVQLLDSSTRSLPANHASLIELKQYIAIEASQFIDITHKSIEEGSVVLTFLDGYDALAVAIMYIFCIYDPNQPASFRLGIAQMKTVTASIDIIQSVAQLFKPLRRCKDIIWALLQTLEARAEGRDVSGPLHDIDRCGGMIPSHVKRLIQLCTQA